MAEMPDPASAIALSLSSLKRDGITLSQQQVAAILCIVNGKDTVVCLPTGHGKSVIFEVLPWHRGAMKCSSKRNGTGRVRHLRQPLHIFRGPSKQL